MIQVSSTDAVNGFHHLLGRVERGETVRILKHGKAKARMVPDCDFLSGPEFHAIFSSYAATRLDAATADAIAANIRRLDHEEQDALAH